MTPQSVIAGLIKRGLPPHIAAGFAGNFEVESGFDPAVNEIAPLVPGSRGGFGLSQWTGPRRRQLEAFAQQDGRSLSDVDLQLDFLMHELGTTEKNAASAIMKAQTPQEAAKLVSEKFLRPGIPHLDRRIAAATRFAGLGGDDTLVGGDGGDVISTQGSQAAPQRSGMPVGLLEVPEMEQERRLLGGLLSEDQRDRLIMGLEGMTLNPNRALMASAGQAIQGRQEAREETKAKQEQAKRVNRTIEWLSQQGRDDLASAVSAGGLPAGDAVRIAMTPQEQAKPTSAIQNYEYARQNGYQGSFADFQNSGAASTNVTVNNNGNQNPVPGLSKLGEGMTYLYNPDGTIKMDEQGRPMAAPVAGTDADRERQQGENAREAAVDQKMQYGQVVLEDIGRVRDMLEGGRNQPITGVLGNIAGRVDGTEASDARALAQTIRANIGFDRLQQMREASPTGGALGQVTERELATLQSVLGNLEFSQSKGQLLENLDRLETTYRGILDKIAATGDGTLVPRRQTQQQSAPNIPEGYTAEDWNETLKYMTPEERRLFE